MRLITMWVLPTTGLWWMLRKAGKMVQEAGRWEAEQWGIGQDS